MEKMPYQFELDNRGAVAQSIAPAAEVQTSEWQRRLPVLTGEQVVLRELRASDAPSLFALLTTDEVARFISPPPSTVEGFVRFIEWTHKQRTAGTYVCFAVTLKGFDTAIGIFQVRALDNRFALAEWGFALGSPFWGKGIFQDGAALVLQFVFDTLGVDRLEARAAIHNGRGHGALLKINAVREAILRKSFCRHGQYFDQVLYSILADDWRASMQRRAKTARREHTAYVH